MQGTRYEDLLPISQMCTIKGTQLVVLQFLFIMNEQSFAIPTHPYYPLNAHIPDYLVNVSSTAELLVRFGSLLSLGIFTTLWLATRWNPRLTTGDKLIIGWFVLCKWTDQQTTPPPSYLSNTVHVMWT